MVPRILIAGTESGSGKTSLAMAIVSALVRRGFKVQTFKTGPDFLDPTYLAAASGRPCYNLDGWMCGREYVERLFARSTAGADCAVIEGVMGLFDGAGPSGLAGSSAEIAAWLRAPVILVANAHGMARSYAALVSGFTSFDKTVTVIGSIANHCGSPHHVAILNTALKTSGLPTLMGAVPRGGLPAVESRHLGLVTADPLTNCGPSVLDAFAESAERHLSVDALIHAMKEAPDIDISIKDCDHSPMAGIRLGVARDAAFHFYYQDLFDELRRRGCEIAWFSPLQDKELPQGIDGLYIGGGYPEVFAEALSANRAMIGAIRRYVETGRPAYAECGGLMYLSRGVMLLDGSRRPLCGVVPAETRMLGRLRRLGYAEATLVEDSLWGNAGDVLRGHEFHYSELVSDPAGSDGWSTVYSRAGRSDAIESPEGFQRGNVLTSYLHIHLASHPKSINRFISQCIKARPHAVA
jgi:cobyrinic acid a,c-diamide synthase